ncbi:sugar phosphate isomerase/epimerase [Telluribacter sp. SYSU D00476]|uniref:sugar phosphate isomerase/epimerase family protein n=1 Tax=Telluribacter sp. SYSU D00476 TaxID=2811430 RepID=UPI001FF519B9|nr:TIM barrel protein [Telluribacter sp. SYSU D00476]
MDLGLSTYSFPWAVGIPGSVPERPITPVELVHQTVKHGLHHLQFGDNLPLHQLSDSSLEELIRTAAQSGVHLEVGTRRLTKEHIALYLGLAVRCGSPFLRVVIDDNCFKPGKEEVIQIIHSLLPDLQAAGVVLAIENHDRFPVREIEEIILATSTQWVGVCLDTANSLGAGEGVREVVEVLAPYTVNLHIKDITIRRVSHKMGFEVDGCPAGKGILPIPWIIEQLSQYGRCRTATLELWSHPESTLYGTLAKEASWVEESIAYLQYIMRQAGR